MASNINMRDVYGGYSWTEEQEKLLNEQGLSFNPENPNYYGNIGSEIYGTATDQAQSRYQGIAGSIADAYRSNIDTAGRRLDTGAKAYEDMLRQQAIQEENQRQMMSNVYGSQASKLAEHGLAGSGYDAYLQGLVYDQYQGRMSDIYGQYQGGMSDLRQIYGDTLSQAQLSKQTGLREAEMQLSEQVGDIEMKKQQAIEERGQQLRAETQQQIEQRKQALAEINLKLSAKDISVAELQYYLESGQISEAQHKQLKDTYQKQLTQDLVSEYKKGLEKILDNNESQTEEKNQLIAQYTKKHMKELDDLYRDKEISEDNYNQLYYEMFAHDIDVLNSIDDIIGFYANAKDNESKIGSMFGNLKSKLGQKTIEYFKNYPLSSRSVISKIEKEAKQALTAGILSESEYNRIVRERRAEYNKVYGSPTSTATDATIQEAQRVAGSKAAVGQTVWKALRDLKKRRS